MSRSASRLLLLLLPLTACRADGDLPPAYRGLAVPKDRLVSEQALAHGRALYLEHCALCHGEHADGRGVRREGLSKPPRDFTDPTWRQRTTPRHVFYTIREGSPGTPMPAWKSLTEAETWDLAAYLLAVSERR
jgi:mono/diheme cytochrome c family protein